jgi:TRAP-type C4-dicarboxylate transport system permease small subunit
MSARATGRDPIARALDATARAALLFAGLSLVVMAAVEFWQVFARYVMNNSPSWTEPVALMFMKCAMMFGAAAGVRMEAHFGFFILVEQAGPAAKRLLKAFARLVVLGTGLVLAAWGFVLMRDGWDIPMAGVPLPEGLGYLPLALGGALIALFAAGSHAGRDADAERED